MQFTHKKNRSLYIPYAGPVLLEFPLLNKGSAFSMEERSNFNLLGLLPEVVETIEEQAERAWIQYQGFKTEIDKHIYLRNIQDTNETLFYRLIGNHLEEMMPVIYTPTVGAACERFSEIYRRARGVFISYQNRHNLDDILQNVPNHNVKVIVVTDGERILGLGDQGIGGMGIPIGKLSLYTTCGGISPAYTLPIVLDVGTNNQQLLDDPLYMGWRHPRITDDEYYQFVDDVIQAIKARWPDVLLQFEDFAQKNAMPLLNRYRNEICSFNDDIQGTAAVTVGTLIAASRGAGSQLSEQKIVFLGAGSAGCGIAEQIIAQIVREGLSEEEARQRVFMVDRFGLLTDGMPNLLPFQNKLVQKREQSAELGYHQRGAVPAGRSAQREAEHPDRRLGSAGTVHGRDYPRDAQALPAADRDAALQPNLTGGSDAAEYPELDRRRGAGRHRQSILPGYRERQAVSHRPVQ